MRSTRLLPLGLLVASLGALAGCTLTLDYNQCKSDDECKTKNAAAPYCTQDNICVSAIPTDRLCSATPYPQLSTKARTTRIGAILQLNGDTANGRGSPDEYRLLFLKYAVDEINTQVAAFSDSIGQVELYVCSVSSKDDAVNAMSLLATAKNPIVAAVGPSFTDGVNALADAAPGLQVPVLFPAATASSLSMKARRGYSFLLAPLDNAHAATMASVVPNRQSIYVVSQQGSYGSSVQQAFVTEYNRRDAMNNMGVSVQTPFDDSAAAQQSLSDLARDLKARSPILNYLVTVTSPSQVGVLKLFKDLPYDSKNASKTTQILMSDGGRSGAMLAYAKQVAEAAVAKPMDTDAQSELTSLFRLRGVSASQLVNNATTTTFKTPFLGKNPGFEFGRDLYMTFAYDAIYTATVAVDSVELAAGATATGADVAKVLRKLNSNGKMIAPLGPGPYPDTVSKVRAAADAIQLEGLTGVIGFDSNDGTRQGASFETWWIDFKPTPPTFVLTDPRAMSMGM